MKRVRNKTWHKLAIALIMIPKENYIDLFHIEHEKNWYRYLFNKMKSPLDEFDQNKLAIITFNYDRSLEQFLFTVLKNSNGKPDQKCAEKLNKIPIIHIYGDLGPLPWQDSKGRSYKPKATISQKIKASSNILTIAEDIPAHRAFKEAALCLSAADQIIFLGFGYHHTNLERLQIKNVEGSKIGSGFGLCNAEAEEIRYNWNIEIPDLKSENLMFLRKYIKWGKQESQFMVI